jgi:zinc protease
MKVLVLALLLTAMPVAARAADPFAAARVTTLPNGLSVLIAPDSTAQSVGLGVWVRAGTRHELAGSTGVTHLIERLMFTGTLKVGPGEYGRRLQAEGGAFSAFSSADHTCFEVTVPPSGLESALRLEADRFANLAISAAELDRVKRLTRDERRTRADQTAVGRVLRMLYGTAWSGHPYAAPVVGADEDLDRITLKQLQAYRADRYVPGHMLVTVMGRVEPAAALDAVRRTLGALPGRAFAPDPAPPLPPSGERRARGSVDAQTPLLAVGWRVPALGDADAAALEALARVFASGAGSRIQASMVRAAGAPCALAQGGLDVRALGGLLYVIGAPLPGVDSARVERGILEAADALVNAGVSADELEAVKRQIEADQLGSWQTPAGAGRAAGESWLAQGDPRGPRRRLDRVQALTSADLQRVARRVFAADTRTVVWIVPNARPEEGRR